MPLHRTLLKQIRATIDRALGKGPELTDARWMVLARIEDDRSGFPPEDHITSQDLDDMIEVFDDAHRRVHLIYGGRDATTLEALGTPGHWADTYPPVGRVLELQRDDINLWGRVAGVVDPVLGVDRLGLAVADGATDRSIGFTRGLAETDGRTALWHVALLIEPPGIPNMPSLDAQGFGLSADDRQALRDRHAGAEARAAMGDGWIPEISTGRQRVQMPEGIQFRSLAASLTGQPTTDTTTSNEETEMTEEERAQLARDIAAGVVAGITPLIRTAPDTDAESGNEEPETPAQPPPEDTDEADAEADAERAAQIGRRARAVGRQAVALGVLSRDAATRQVERVTAALERSADSGLQALELFDAFVTERGETVGPRLVRVHEDDEPVAVNPRARQWAVLTSDPDGPPGVDERRLAIMDQAIAAVRREDGSVDDSVLMREVERRLRLEGLLKGAA